MKLGMEPNKPPRLGDDTDDRARALPLLAVSRETEARLAVYVGPAAPLADGQESRRPSHAAHVWTRHIADSAQLVPLAPEARTWVDMGSGAGFPGLVIAILLRERAGRARPSHREQRPQMRLPARSRPGDRRAGRQSTPDASKTCCPSLAAVDVLTARALAPLPQLLAVGQDSSTRGRSGLFLKGEEFAARIDATCGRISGRMRSMLDRRASTHAAGRIAAGPRGCRLDGQDQSKESRSCVMTGRDRASWCWPTRRAASARPRRRSISARRSRRSARQVLLVDLDPQGNASTGLGIDRKSRDALDLSRADRRASPRRRRPADRRAEPACRALDHGSARRRPRDRRPQGSHLQAPQRAVEALEPGRAAPAPASPMCWSTVRPR